MPPKTRPTDDTLLDALIAAQKALQAAPPREAIRDDIYWRWLAGPRQAGLDAIEKAL